MNAKKAVAAALLLFVAASVLYLVTGAGGRAPATGERGPDGATTEGAPARVVATYFHGTARCPTCLTIERTAHDVLQRDLAADFERGAIEWRTVDFEEPGNEHFAREFELTGATLVLTREAGGRTERWDRLDRVWELVGDDDAFRDYVLHHARDYLAES